ncbi:MAG: LysR substrate-binding domain-containing protein, partial [Clostridia bacterium]|nr:LysR substrate-binding domain-containing protein [Clostridia bacterium]
MLDRWYGAVDDLAELADTTTGTVILSASSAFARLSILPLLPEFSRQFPGIVLDLRLEDQYVDLKNGDTDLLIRVGLLQDEDIIARPLMPLD